MDILALVLVMTARCLVPYFQAHLIKVLTKAPLKNALQCPDASGHLMNWEIKLSEFDTDYLPRNAVMG